MTTTEAENMYNQKNSWSERSVKRVKKSRKKELLGKRIIGHARVELERTRKNVFASRETDECKMNTRKRNIDELRMVVRASTDTFKFG